MTENIDLSKVYNGPSDNTQLLFDQAKKKYQWPDTIDIQMLEYVKKFDGQDLWLLYKTFKQNGGEEYIDTKNIKTLTFSTGRAHKEKTAPLFEGNLFFTREPAKGAKRSTIYRLLPAGKTLIEWMDKNPELVNEQRMYDLTMVFVTVSTQGETSIVKGISKHGSVNVHCISEKAARELEKIRDQIYFEFELQEKYGWTKEKAQEVIEKHGKDINHIQEVIKVIETEYKQYGAISQWQEPTGEYLYEILMNAEIVEEK